MGAPNPVGEVQDLITRCMILSENKGKDLNRGLELLWNYLVGAQGFQLFHFSKITRAHEVSTSNWVKVSVDLTLMPGSDCVW